MYAHVLQRNNHAAGYSILFPMSLTEQYEIQAYGKMYRSVILPCKFCVYFQLDKHALHFFL